MVYILQDQRILWRTQIAEYFLTLNVFGAYTSSRYAGEYVAFRPVRFKTPLDRLFLKEWAIF